MASDPNRASSNLTERVPWNGNILTAEKELTRFLSIPPTISQTSFRGEPNVKTTSEVCLEFFAMVGINCDIDFPLREAIRNLASGNFIEISDRLWTLITR
jgi:hypothetical protein